VLDILIFGEEWDIIVDQNYAWRKINLNYYCGGQQYVIFRGK